ncbi:MAG: YbaB/EbfC family nucleoid-associated protein [Candidatus Pacebacteria bacterium]|nr:YbaB/EbfC family nucleoid-associated protein [Candidatus Paceibacterota bacterium]
MLDKLKQLKELKKMQDELAKEMVEVEKQGTKVVINGKMEIEEIVLNSELQKEEQEKILKDCINEAMNKMKIKMAQRMQQMPGMGF